MLVDQVLERELQEELDEAERLLTSEETDEEMPAVGVTAAAVSEPEIIVLDEAMPGVVVDRSGNTHSAGPVAIAGPSRAVTAQVQVPVIDIGSSDDDDEGPPELSLGAGPACPYIRAALPADRPVLGTRPRGSRLREDLRLQAVAETPAPRTVGVNYRPDGYDSWEESEAADELDLYEHLEGEEDELLF